MYGFGYNISEVMNEQRLKAFKHYVSAWKKQNADTVTVKNDIYSYTTKRGKKYSFKAAEFKDFKANPTKGWLKVETFYFEDLNLSN